MNNTKKAFQASICFFVLFIIFTLMVKCVDVRAIGPQDSEVGFAGINLLVHRLTGVNMGWYKLTNGLGYFALALAAVFCLIGLKQLICFKNIKKVDYRITLLGVLYVAVGVMYVLFEKLIINYRPEIIDAAEGLEASYPSSHTLLAIVIFITAIRQFNWLIKNKTLCSVMTVAALVLALVSTVGRLLSGVHWASDIIASVILSAAFIELYNGCIGMVRDKRVKEQAENLTK